MNNDFDVIDLIYNHFINEISDNQEIYNKYISNFSNFNLKFLKSLAIDDINIDWLIPIEDSLISFNTIINNPNLFITSVNDLVNVEKSKNINKDTIKHLSKNSRYLNKIDEEIIPSKLLNDTKDDTLHTYENRFVFTLLKRCNDFFNEKMGILNEIYSLDEKSKLDIKGEEVLFNNKLSFDLHYSYLSNTTYLDEYNDIYYDISTLHPFLRIKRVSNIFNNFSNSLFYKELKKAPLLNENIIMTNVLLNNNNYKPLIDLWNYLINYENKESGILNVDLLASFNNNSEFLNKEFKALQLITFSLFYKTINNKNKLNLLKEESTIESYGRGKEIKEYLIEEEKSIKLKEESYFILKMKKILKRALRHD